MVRKLLKENPVNWRELFSFQIFKLDVIDGFKYRIKQALFFLFLTAALLALLLWGFSYDLNSSNRSSLQAALLVLLYLPAMIGLMFWFRAGLSYDFDEWKTAEKEKPKNKKSLQAKFALQVTTMLFGGYYAYWMWRLWQISYH